MITIAIIFIVVLFASNVFLMLILIEVIDKKDEKIEHLNQINDELCKENLELMDKLLGAYRKIN